MAQVFRSLRILLFVLLAGFLHYALPQHDVARITQTEIKREDFSGWNRIFYAQADSGASEETSRDMRYIYTEKQNTWLLGFWSRESSEIMVYRNEDTGWGWPPYFKFDSSNVQAEAASNQTGADADKWVVITHYGWRNKYLSAYPNAISIRPVDGPDNYPIPWFNIVFFGFVLFAIGMVRAMWRQFRERTIDPTLDDIHDHASETGGRIGRWWKSWTGGS